MFCYFGYGSNLSETSLRAKGVMPVTAEPAILRGWRLCFDIPNFFSIEGGTGNIRESSEDAVHGVLYSCNDHDLATLDALEALGVAYERRQLSVETYSGRRSSAYVYVGLPDITTDGLKPSRRYLNILIRGGEDMHLAPEYIDGLRRTEVCLRPRYGVFRFPDEPALVFAPEELARQPQYTAIAGAVFDMSDARPEHRYLKQFFCARDVTLFFLKRMDSSDGGETWEDIESGNLSPLQKEYLNDYLHQFNNEYRYVGKMYYAAALRPPSVPSIRLRRPSQFAEIGPRRVLRIAERTNQSLRHENLGFLSNSHGFMPLEQPRQQLTRSFEAWDQVIAELTLLYRDLRVRSAIDSLPILDASPDNLPDADLLRAAAVLGILSHAYWYVETAPPERLPTSLERPWEQVRERLGRDQPVLTYIDLIVYNWSLIDSERRDPMRADNMRLLFPTVNNREERTFYLTQTEILAQASPIISAAVRAQEAVAHDDPKGLSDELCCIIESLERIVHESLLNINPNPASPSYVDPVVWAKTVAPFAVPMKPGLQGPSGTSSPIFNLLDVFFGRSKHDTFLGREIRQLRQGYPLFWRELLGALGEISVPEYIGRVGDPNLSGLLKKAVEVYAGENGFLGRHRMKVFGYIELAFKVGRSVTIGGFGGVFKDRTWDRVDNELEYSRIERLESFPRGCHHARIKSVGQTHTGASDGVKHVVLDITGTGVRYQPGDRCGILPENENELVLRTLSALRAEGHERIVLTPEWCAAVRMRAGYESASELSLRDVLRFGRIRPVVPRVAEALHAATQSKALLAAIVNQSVTRWELWDLLVELANQGYDPARLWKNTPDSAEYVCRVLPPETFRMYSIASVMDAPSELSDPEIELTVGRVRYSTEADDQGLARERRGTASNFLGDSAGRGEPVSFIVEHPPRFSLPKDPQIPIVMLAGGTGISPFRAFVLERLRQPDSGMCYLFFALRSREDLYYHDELLHWVRTGKLTLQVAFSRDDVDLRHVNDHHGGTFVHENRPRRRIRDLLLDEANAATLKRLLASRSSGGEGAYVYVCGRSRFARSVNDAFRELLARLSEGDARSRSVEADHVLQRMVGEGRFMQEIFTDARSWDIERRQLDVSDIIERNDDRYGYWIVIDSLVYDISEFIRLHPGGVHVLSGYAGMDATQGYLRAHRNRSEIEAMREMYEIGAIRPIDFRGVTRSVYMSGRRQTVALSAFYRAWTHFAYLVVEMQNALRNDHWLQAGVTTHDDPPSPRSLYKLQRSIETHERFLRSYVDGISAEPLSALWDMAHAMCSSGLTASWLNQRLSDVRTAPTVLRVEALTSTLKHRHQELVDSRAAPGNEDRERLARVLDLIAVLDADFLLKAKTLLREGLMLFETHEARTLEEADSQLINLILSLPELIEGYYDGVHDQCGAQGWSPSVVPEAAFTPTETAPDVTTLVSNELWLMEEDQQRCIVWLRRSAQPIESIDQLVLQNHDLIAQIRPQHKEFGVLVDMRQAHSRNDPEFEDAMRALRGELGRRYARIAVLVTSAVGVLQVNRMSRNEGAEAFTLATQSETAAVRFAMGG